MARQGYSNGFELVSVILFHFQYFRYLNYWKWIKLDKNARIHLYDAKSTTRWHYKCFLRDTSHFQSVSVTFSILGTPVFSGFFHKGTQFSYRFITKDWTLAEIKWIILPHDSTLSKCYLKWPLKPKNTKISPSKTPNLAQKWEILNFLQNWPIN